jgi:acyl-CoA reductase-like NAD-dependent aldehyde dehydrogenase
MRNGKIGRNGNRNGNGSATHSRAPARPRALDQAARLPVAKTYKIFIGGKFPRSESGRFYPLKHPGTGDALANVCLCSRKDFRDSVVAARAAQGSWAGRSAYNRGQVLYRIAEMLEGRAVQFVSEMIHQGVAQPAAQREVTVAIDRLIYYAGWADKYQQVFSSVNPVASSHFNFSILEPTGVVSILCPPQSALLGIVSTIIPAIVGGNTVIALAPRDLPLSAVTFAEVLATSDLPGGVVNILTGERSELIEYFANHMDVNAVIYCGDDATERATVRVKSAMNVKRAVSYGRKDWLGEDAQNPYFILDTQEVKTTWHPIGV